MPPADVERIRAVTGLSDAEHLLFCGAESMKRNTEQLIAEMEGDPELFGLASSRRTGAPVAEPLLCLDYRGNRERPAVVVSDWTGGGQARWPTIAADIEELSAKMGL